MKLSYGISDFMKMRTTGLLYVDKTAYIEKLEQLNADYVFFIRPRRFGKSLFLSVLEHYYDVKHKDEFSRLFSDLYIGEHPTELRNKYIVLKLNFSALNTGSKTELEASFSRRVIQGIRDCTFKYPEYFDGILIKWDEHITSMMDVGAILLTFLSSVKQTGFKVYLFIDEYDHFANDIIAMGSGDLYKDVIHASGIVRDFYEAVKIGAESVIDRLFITGISPIMLDDMTSGFNISTNLTMHVAVNEMLGFTEQEVRNIMDHIGMDQDREGLMEELRNNYNGYLFNKDGQARVYNPDMILYFFHQWQTTGQFPEQLIDDNVKTDYGRLKRLIANEHNRLLLDEIIQSEKIAADIVSKFSFDQMYDENYFVSLLFYMGLLTIDRQEKTRLLLKVPNYVIKTLFWEFITQRLERNYELHLNTGELRKSIEIMAYEGRIRPYIEYISKHVIIPLSNRDLAGFDEKHIKVILFAYLSESRAYRPVSELENENGFIDIYLERDRRIPDIRFEWILELKYLKKSDAKMLEETKRKGIQQLERYSASRNFGERTDVKQALIIFIGKNELMVVE